MFLKLREKQIDGAKLGLCVEQADIDDRYLVQWTDSEGIQERYLPCLDHVKPQIDDRLLLLQPDNGEDAIIVGVLKGMGEKTDRVSRSAIQPGRQGVRVLSHNGTPLVELRQGAKGPTLRLLNDDVDMEVAGELQIKAGSIALAAQQGDVKIEANDEVIIKGEMILLN